MDVVAVHQAALSAIEHARSGQGPIILEMLTYRYRGHSMSDPAKYRSKDEVTTMRAEHDPIEQVKARILEQRFSTEESLKQVEADVRAIVTEAADFATNDVEPDAAELWTDIYADA
jgi:pyruvate dehydrogenase E1 component alpha subunit